MKRPFLALAAATLTVSFALLPPLAAAEANYLTQAACANLALEAPPLPPQYLLAGCAVGHMKDAPIPCPLTSWGHCGGEWRWDIQLTAQAGTCGRFRVLDGAWPLADLTACCPGVHLDPAGALEDRPPASVCSRSVVHRETASWYTDLRVTLITCVWELQERALEPLEPAHEAYEEHVAPHVRSSCTSSHRLVKPSWMVCYEC